MRIKLFEEFETEKSYTPEAEKLLNEIESLMDVKLPADLFYNF